VISGQLQIEDVQQLQQAVEQAVPSLDYEALLQEAKNNLQLNLQNSNSLRGIDVSRVPESDPISKLLEVLAYRELITRQKMNEALKACFLSTAQGEDLRRLAALIIPSIGTASMNKADDGDVRGAVINEYRNIHTAGSAQAYKTLAIEAADAGEALHDVHVESLRKSEVDVYLLYQPDTPPDQQEAIREKVFRCVTDDAVRPIGQFVQVQPAKVIDYRIKATLGFRDRLGAAEAISSARIAVQQYVKEKYYFGSNLYSSALLSVLYQPGVDYIVLQALKPNRALADVAVGANEAPWCGDIDIQLHTDVPEEKVAGVSVHNVRLKRNYLSCDIDIAPPQHEIRLTKYTLYWGGENRAKLSGYGTLESLPVGGARRIHLSSTPIPEDAHYLLIFTVNENGEMGAFDKDLSAGYAVPIPTANNA